MRQIKFRYWDVNRKCFITDGEVFFNAEDCIYAGSFNSVTGEFEITEDITGNTDVSQFTGFKDRNNKEIYEDDIVCSTSGQIGYVFWDRGCYFVKWVKNTLIKEEYESYLWEVRKSIEVIGNQFEHPHLLEETE